MTISGGLGPIWDDPTWNRDVIGEGPVVMVSNLGPDDATFHGEFGDDGWITWNVTRLLDQARIGLHGPAESFPTADAMASIANVEIEPRTAERYARKLRRSEPEPALAVELRGRLYFLDGHHRIHGAHRAGRPHIDAWIVRNPSPYTRVIKRRFPDHAALERFKAQVRALRQAEGPLG